MPAELTWNLNDIFPDWTSWEAACKALDAGITKFASLRGTLGKGPAELLAAMRASDELGQLAYKVYYYAALCYDEDQRDNEVNARRQQVADAAGAVDAGDVVVQPRAAEDAARDCSGLDARRPALAVYRFALEEVYRQQEHVLDEDGERMLALASPARGPRPTRPTKRSPRPTSSTRRSR